MFICLTNVPRSSPSINLTIKQANLNHNNVFLNKLMNMRLNLIISFPQKKEKFIYIYISNIIFLYVCLCKNIQLEIRLYKFVNKFI